MKTLVYITNYEGNKKVDLLNLILKEFNEFDSLSITIIIYTTEKLLLDTHPNLNINIEIKPKVFSNSPHKAHWQPEPEFIWLHRKDLLNKINEYELFIHLEDDILVTEEYIKTFLKYNKKLRENYIMGGLLFEKEGEKMLLPQFHNMYRGIKNIIDIDGEKYLTIKNNHQASWIATSTHLNRLIKKGYMGPKAKLIPGFNIKCSAVTEIYNTPVLKKVFPISELDNCFIEHLSKKYIKLNTNKKSKTWYHQFQYKEDLINNIKKINK